jgi:hypothetical protein
MRVEAILVQHARISAMEQEAEADHEVEGKPADPAHRPPALPHEPPHWHHLLKRREAGRPEEVGTILLREGNLIQATVGLVEGEKALFGCWPGPRDRSPSPRTRSERQPASWHRPGRS